MLKKYLDPFFNTRAAGVYIFLFATSIGIATFIENDFGTSSAQKVIYQTWWFELLLILFGTTILVNIFRFRIIQKKKWPLFIFHTSMIVILIGAALTRYIGFEGMMHIRENDASNQFLSAETYLQFEVIKDNQKFQFDEPVLFATLGNNRWDQTYLINDKEISVKVEDFIPNPQQILEDDPEGQAIIKIVLGGANGREEYFLQQGDSKRIRSLVYNFSDNILPNAININYAGEALTINSDRVLVQTVMVTQQKDTLLPDKLNHPLRLRSLYTDGENSFVFGDFREKGIVKLISENPKVKGESMTALKMNIDVNGEEQETFVFGKKGLSGRPSILRLGGISMAISYGAKPKILPFSIKLYDFIMERYPGTNSAASYASEVQLIDERKNVKRDFRIYMNNILDYRGYRFFQSSFDKDEAGTYLSVNNDFWGTWVSYLGYFLLTLGLILSMLSKKSRFYQVSQNIKKIRASHSTICLLFIFSFFPFLINAQKVIAQQHTQNIVDLDHATAFSKLIVQDHNGRMKPVHTMTREVMRKLARKESLFGLSADQIVLGMLANSHDWNNAPMFKIGKHQSLHEKLGISGQMASYNNFFEPDGQYILRDEVRRAYSLQPIDRGVYEKELMKIDERVNIASMVYSGRLFKLIPIPGDPNNTWVSNHVDHGKEGLKNPAAERFFNSYLPGVREAMQTKDYSFVDKAIVELDEYQQSNGEGVIPSRVQISAEILLNKMNVFSRLSILYMLLGLGFLFLLFGSVFNPSLNMQKAYLVLFSLMLIGFILHTMGLGIRWYVSERAPWSNGYESMIYIAWTSTLAGVLFTRKSLGGLAATMVLAATVLLVAGLSFLDPEITPLVPVLKSYWLTIHVSLEAGSYGFLMLGAIIGFINLILLIFVSAQNKDRIVRMVREMSYISEMTLIGGITMISIGTYLGGVWANESWGRYWGWDAKETWALVTILVYAFILHMRIIPKLNGLFAYNFASLFGWASVIMTYYGVNYYLSGLHSYAAGDPVPIPSWVYFAIVGVAIISILAYWRKSKQGIMY